MNYNDKVVIVTGAGGEVDRSWREERERQC